ncbi:putative ubiquitin [Hibiscus syriacus]|uniref:Ubiquitin n=1 Tax=Hibiscus syriacus TaxID=106335 RepID=A0A6A2WL32_HIBSY|nr:putative ubiquitin [Hibiscus syriacus]
MDPKGTIVFTSVGRPQYGFDIFTVNLTQTPITSSTSVHRLTDGISVNYNAQFVNEDQSIVFISERSGSPQIYLTRPGVPKPEKLPSAPYSLFHDRPIIKSHRLYFISAHEQLINLSRDAVASYGSRPWEGDFHELKTDIVVFPSSDPEKRWVVCERGGWPTWSGDSTIFFHRQAADGWWSIFRFEFAENSLELSDFPVLPLRVTPPGLHCFTPAAFHDGKRIAVATRRRGKRFRHIEVFDLELKAFRPVTELLNPNFHHYNPFVSPDSETLDTIDSEVNRLRASRRPDGSFPALNPALDENGGIKVVKSDGSKRWSLIKSRVAFYNTWSSTERYVIYSSLGPIFESVKTTVQIARIKFDSSDLNDDLEEIQCDVKILTREDTGNNAFPSCSPDGKSLVFRSGRSGHKNLYVLDAVNGEFNGGIRKLTDGPWIDTMPCWSPNGDLIAFSSIMHNPNNVDAFSIYVIKPDGSDLRRIYVAGPKGSSIVDRERINHVFFSPNGEWLVFAANIGGVTVEPISCPNQYQPYGDLYVVKLDGSGLRRITYDEYENGTPTWHSGSELDIGRLCFKNDVGVKLTGAFDEPLWINCDID